MGQAEEEVHACRCREGGEALRDLGDCRGDNHGWSQMLAAVTTPEFAVTLEAIISCRSGHELDVVRLAGLLRSDSGTVIGAVDAADDVFHSLFGIHLLPSQRAWFDDGGKTDGDPAVTVPDCVPLASSFLDLLDRPHQVVPTTATPPVIKPSLASWIEAVAAALRSREPLHLAFRCRHGSERDLADLAALLADAGAGMLAIDAGHRVIAAGLLRAELHEQTRSAVTVIRSGGLLAAGVENEPGDGEIDGWRTVVVMPFVEESRSWLGSLSGVCIWCVPLDAVLPAALDGLIAACIGPIRPEASWARGLIAEAIGCGVGMAGVAAIAATLDDPRDVRPRATAARLLSTAGMEIDEACATVARSFVPLGDMSSGSVDFDLELHADDPEIALLFARAREVALAGGRLLFHGPPGGGKSTVCAALAAEMVRVGAAGPPVSVTAARICVRPYGGTERILAELWRRAAIARSPLMIDELDAMCGVRDPSDSSGNAYLVRMMTDEWIRNLDANPQVPVLATVNDLAVDPAVLRRFTSCHHVGADLSPGLERRAWSSLLGMDPPVGWKPCGGSPSDFDVARRRCRMLGLEDAASLAASIERAREARRGARTSVRRPHSTGPLH